MHAHPCMPNAQTCTQERNRDSWFLGFSCNHQSERNLKRPQTSQSFCICCTKCSMQCLSMHCKCRGKSCLWVVLISVHWCPLCIFECTSVCLCGDVIVYIAAYVCVCVSPLHWSPTLFKLSVRVRGLILLFTQALEPKRQPRLRMEA